MGGSSINWFTFCRSSFNFSHLDKCTCHTGPDGYPEWTGNDCSLRTCPNGPAWAAPPTKKNGGHPVMECSGKGSCDRTNGECKCDPNYDGMACERTVCPNDCSGRGVCLTQKALAAEAGTTYDLPWDAEKHVGCKCDIGYRGPDCSRKECPSGIDVMGGDGNEQGRECSGRGLCNYSEGLCICHTGYMGTRCEKQTVHG
jgi:hypothetical protein